MIRRQVVIAFALLLLAGVPEPPRNLKLVQAARIYVENPVRYDGSYRKLVYPGGDPGGGIGVCSDLVIRAYRSLGIDLQRLVHEDISRNFRKYPVARLYNQTKPDPNIDHRRVPNLLAFFQRHAISLPLSIEGDDLATWQAGDVVIFDLLSNGIPSHIGIVSDKTGLLTSRPLVIHHFPPFPTEDDTLGHWKIIGHFRYIPHNERLDGPSP